MNETITINVTVGEDKENKFPEKQVITKAVLAMALKLKCDLTLKWLPSAGAPWCTLSVKKDSDNERWMMIFGNNMIIDRQTQKEALAQAEETLRVLFK